jgi:hypothetical protein
VIENPICCPICLAHWDFATTWLGQLVEVHPVTHCIPPTYAFETEDDLESITPSYTRMCVECKTMFTPDISRSKAMICGAECRKVRRDRKKLQSEERCRMRWEKAA